MITKDRAAFLEMREHIYRCAIREMVYQRFGLGPEIADRITDRLDADAVWDDYLAGNFADAMNRAIERAIQADPAIHWWPWSEVPAWQ